MSDEAKALAAKLQYGYCSIAYNNRAAALLLSLAKRVEELERLLESSETRFAETLSRSVRQWPTGAEQALIDALRTK